MILEITNSIVEDREFIWDVIIFPVAIPQFGIFLSDARLRQALKTLP